MTWISYKRYRELIPLFAGGDHPMSDVDHPDRHYKGFGPSVSIRTPPNWNDWGEANFSLEDVKAWLAWDAERRLSAS